MTDAATRIRNTAVDADERRFWRWGDRNVQRPNEPGMETNCWIWTGARNRKKQPMFWYAGATRYAGRWLWQHWNGPLPAGTPLRRACKQPMCVRPSHGLPAGSDERR